LDKTFLAMGRPIIPNPMNPICFGIQLPSPVVRMES
jgi:hypothetical protein